MISIVIPCRDDARVVACARSVDVPEVEVLVVLNGSPAGFHERLAREVPTARVEVLTRANRSHAVEHGITVARHDHVVLMDSDCVFEPGSVAALIAAFAQGDPHATVFKGDIVFEPGTSLASALVARSRTRRMAARLTAYKPPLGLSRVLRARLGGRFFDPRLPWKEDADFDQRVRAAHIGIVHVPGCVIRHAAIGPRTDLRSSFLYGVGAAIAAHLAVPLPRPNRSIHETFTRDGAAAAAYLVVANGVRSAGVVYGRARIRWQPAWLEALAR